MPSAGSTSGGIRAGRAFVELFADDSKLVRGLRAAEKKLKAFGQGIRNLGLKVIGLGAAILAPLAASAKFFSSYGDQVAKMAKRTGLSVETLSELRFVASQTGTEFESLEMAFRKMQRSIFDAGRGLSTQTDALDELGLKFEDLDGLSPEHQFKLLADRIGKVEDPTKRAAIAMSLFGRTGTNLLPMFAAGAKGIEQLQERARELGLTMSKEDAESAEEFTDALDALWKVIKMGVFNVGAALAPTLQMIAEKITAVATKVSAWIKQNRQLIVTVLKIGAIVMAAGIALVALGTTISGLGSAIGLLITVVTTVVAVFKLLAATIAFVVSPIGLVIAAMAALGAFMIQATDVSAKALDWLGDRFQGLKDTALAAWRGIGDALAAGDISLAAKILWLTLKMEFQKGINVLKAAWLKFKHFFIDIGNKAFFGLLAAGEMAWHGMQVAWIETVAFFKKLWHSFASGVASTWRKVVGWVERRIHDVHGIVDSDFDAEEAKRLSEQQQRADLNRIQQEKDAAISAVERERDLKRKQEAAVHEQTLGLIGREYDESRNRLDDEAANQRRESEVALEQARQEWLAALEAARQRRIAAEEGGGPGRLESPNDLIEKARRALDGLGDTIDKEAENVGVRGTFNAAAIQALQAGGNTDERIAKAAEDTARNTKRIERAILEGQFAFA